MAAVVTDIELILDDIRDLLRANLNNQIAAVNAEKNDGMIMRSVDNAAYFLQTLDGPIANFDPFILYGLDDPRAQGIGPATLKSYKIQVVLCVSDDGQDLQIARKMFRYSRALEETIETYFAGINRGFKMAIESLAPIQFTLMNTSNNYRAIGVSITVGMA